MIMISYRSSHSPARSIKAVKIKEAVSQYLKLKERQSLREPSLLQIRRFLTKDVWEVPYLFLTVILILIGICVTVFLWIKSHREEIKEQAEANAKEEAEAKKTKQC